MENQRGAVNEAQSGGIKYMNVIAGKFSQRASEDTPNAIGRVLKKGKNEGPTIFELQYTQLTGRLTDIQKGTPSEYGINWDIFIDVSTEAEPDTKIKLSVGYSSSYIKRLFSSLPKLDLSKDITLKAFDILDKNTGKTKYYVVPYQNGNKVLPHFTRDEPNGKPPMVEKEFNGMKQWDSTDEMKFYEDELPKYIKLMAGYVSPIDKLKDVLGAIEENEDDMPF